MEEEKLGVVTDYFSKPGVAAMEITEGVLKIGDRIHIKGHTTDFEETVSSMQVEHSAVEEAKAGDLVGIKVSEKARPNDQVYKIIE